MIEQLLQADRMLNVDQVDRAEAMYQGVSDLDPANAIAVVGLARCALARGDDRRAHELASKALLIDPENDMARRMEARLAEILTMRGERVSRPAASSHQHSREMRPMITSEVADAVTLTSAAPAGNAQTPAPVRRGFLARLLGR